MSRLLHRGIPFAPCGLSILKVKVVMANHKSAIKRNRQNIKRREHNRGRRAEVRTALKKASAAVAAGGNSDEAKKLAREAESLMSKASKKGLFHKATLARKISRLASKASKSAA